MRNHIVILGGMGPQASTKLHELLIAKSADFIAGAPDEFPAILHASMQIPDFISNKANEVLAIDIIKDTMQMMNIAQAESIALACNTAHQLTENLGLNRPNFVSMIDAVCDEIMASGVKRVGLLASPNTVRSQLYEIPLAARGIEVITPDDSELKTLETVIRTVISGRTNDSLGQTLDRLAFSLIERGAKAVLLGCTELPLIGLSPSVKSFDSLNALADALLKRHFVIQQQTNL